MIWKIVLFKIVNYKSKIYINRLNSFKNSFFGSLQNHITYYIINTIILVLIIFLF